MGTFHYDSERFYINGEPVTLLSGSIHYFRTVPEYWRDRLKKLRQLGFNTVETYTCWNLHERKENQFDFSGMLDLGRFLDIAKEEGLYAIVRPGPYICAEWDLGGMPSWLLAYENMRIRCYDERFLEKEKRYLSQLFEILVPRLITNGGNILMMQVENEYGSYGNDKKYLRALAEHYKACGVDVPLFTSDGPGNLFLGGGTVPEMLATINLGSNPIHYFDFMKNRIPNTPPMVMEYWEGWFDTWYYPHHRRTPDDVAQELDAIISYGGNVNYYMFLGGTNFGFWNGVNMIDGKFCPQTTSYDYDAILTESGDLTKRYFECRAVLEKHFGDLPEITVGNLPKKAYGNVRLTESVLVTDSLKMISKPEKCAYPKTFEELGVDFGFVMYSTEFSYPLDETELVLDPVRDFAIFFVNGKFAGIKERDRRNDTITVSCCGEDKVRIDVLVENMGRVNYGPTIQDNKKGLVGGLRLGQQYMFDWEMHPLTMDDLSGLVFGEVTDMQGIPQFLRGNLHVDGEPCDTFLRLDGFTKGFVTVNGFNIGRYWNTAGPQKTLYVPAPLLREGDNEIIVFEEIERGDPVITFCDTPDLG